MRSGDIADHHHMKILLVHNSYLEPGGEDVVFENERQLLTSAGHEVLTYRRSNSETQTTSVLTRIALVERAVWSVPARRDFVEILRRFRPDVVHVHNTFLVISPSIYSACKQENVPVVQTLHNYRMLCPAANFFREGRVCEECTTQGVWHGVRHACYRNSRAATATAAMMLTYNRLRGTWTNEIDCYIALTNFARNKFIQGGIEGHKIRVKPNFVHPDPGVRTRRCDFAMYVGRVSAEKGANTLIDAWRLLPQNMLLRVVGDGPAYGALKSEIARWDLPIRLDGRLAHEATIEALKQARFLVFTSELYENFPMTILEAFACGVPVIASDMPSIRDIVHDGRTGLLFRTGNAQDLAEKVAWAFEHPEEVAALGENAREEFRTKYTARENYEMLMDIYAQVSGRGALDRMAA